eukprot:TRINITY_DN8548_c0_g1_i1.p1 TRINITY_DN8548_c0_g1~~TRINITY_DN8548_c0_g1_i1.p1  ORF type:complete len:752 (+),score=248.19 TRINITY_DN8548_c0_g1_i1:66-2258(+)
MGADGRQRPQRPNPFEEWREREADERTRRSLAALSGSGPTSVAQTQRLKLRPEPAARFNYGCAADETGMFVFGGVVHDGHIPVYKNDLWRLSAVKGEWKKLEHHNAPIQREGHTMVVRNDRVLVVFGGINTNGELNGVHLVDTTLAPLVWQTLHPFNSPPRRTGHSAVLYRDDELMVVFGGKGPQGQLSDTWVFYFRDRVWQEVRTHDSPPPRWQHSAVVVDGWMYVFGGGVQVREQGHVLSPDEAAALAERGGEEPPRVHGRAYVADSNDLFMISLESLAAEADKGSSTDRKSLVWWTPVDCDVRGRPRARRGQSMVVFGTQLVVCAGQASGMQRPLDCELGDLWRFDVDPDVPDGLQWRRIETSQAIGRRWGHRAANIGGSKLLVFGGMATEGARRDLHTGEDLLSSVLVLDLSHIGAKPPVFAQWPPGCQMGCSTVDEERRLRESSELVHRGHSFGVQLERHHLLGKFSNRAFLQRVAHQQAAFDDAQILSQHDPAYAVYLDWSGSHNKPADAALAAQIMRHAGALRGLAQRARGVLEQTDMPCCLCGAPQRDAVLVPCGHVATCLLCATDKLVRCPCCSAQVHSAQRFFDRKYNQLRHKLVSMTPAAAAGAVPAPASPLGETPASPRGVLEMSSVASVGTAAAPPSSRRGPTTAAAAAALAVSGQHALRRSRASPPMPAREGPPMPDVAARRRRVAGARPLSAPRPLRSASPSLWVTRSRGPVAAA